MKSSTWVWLAGGAIALYLLYKHAQSSSADTIVVPTAVAGNYYNLPAPSTLSINDPSIVAARGAVGGQATCDLAGGRFIKTVDGAQYGVCVTNAQFSAWSAAPPTTQAGATIALVQAFFNG